MDVSLEKAGHIIVYKIVEHYGEVKRDEIIKLAKTIYLELLNIEVSEDVIVNWIREITCSTDKRSKYGVIYPRAKGFYKVKEGIRVIPENKNIWDKVDIYLKTNVILDIPYERRVEHTKRIKQEVLEPWIKLLKPLYFYTPMGILRVEERESEFDPINNANRYYGEKFSFEDHVLFEDLKNHIPMNLENPVELYKDFKYACLEFWDTFEETKGKFKKTIQEIINEFPEDIKQGFSIDELTELLWLWYLPKYLDRVKVKIDTSKVGGYTVVTFAEFTIFTGKLPNENVEVLLQWLERIKQDRRFIEFKNTKFEALETKVEELEEMRKNILKILEKMSSYEVLPGKCEYLTTEGIGGSYDSI